MSHESPNLVTLIISVYCAGQWCCLHGAIYEAICMTHTLKTHFENASGNSLLVPPMLLQSCLNCYI